jgi:hypothetical protein
MRHIGIIVALLITLMAMMVASIHAQAELQAAGVSLDSKPGPYNPNEPGVMKAMSGDGQEYQIRK